MSDLLVDFEIELRRLLKLPPIPKTPIDIEIDRVSGVTKQVEDATKNLLHPGRWHPMFKRS